MTESGNNTKKNEILKSKHTKKCDERFVLHSEPAKSLLSNVPQISTDEIMETTLISLR